MAATASVMALAAVTGWTSAADAGQIPATASAAADCDGEIGLIVVTIADDNDFRYDIIINGEVFELGVTIDGEEDLVYEVPENGDYTVDVFVEDIEQFILLDELVTVDCAPVGTTTTTTVPVDPPDVGAVVAEPDFTG